MELTKAQRDEIEKITEGLNCCKDFKCCKSGFDNLCKAVDIGFESLLICSEDSKGICRFRVFIGDSVFCTCPLRSYIAKNIEK